MHTPFCTRNCAAVTFFFLPPAWPSALSAFCCSFFCMPSPCQNDDATFDSAVSDKCIHTIDHIFNILAVLRFDQSTGMWFRVLGKKGTMWVRVVVVSHAAG